ncbi:hypothetical protein H6504_04075 [Candidatus Woesearchaeota archaeon]|nr:hypothetical protein [Candidatus Woesearchaeota archaeon]
MNVQKKLKPVLPTLREKKRYMVFEYDSKGSLSKDAIIRSITKNFGSLVGTLGAAKAGMQVLKDKFDRNTGILRINHRYVDHVKASFVLLREIDGHEVMVRSLGVSGILKKTMRFTGR